MKRMFLFASVAVVAIACNNNTNDSGATQTGDTSKNTTNAADAKPADTKDPVAKKGLELVASHACFGCHQVDKGIQGPAYNAVAERYPKNDAVIDSLSNKVMRGGSGNWGTIPMPPNPVTKEEAVTMVTYILSLKK
jgi:cytochrome c